jgi:phosphocarrier protein
VSGEADEPKGDIPKDELSQEPPYDATGETPSDEAPVDAVVTRTVSIVNRRGLHARAAARLVNTAERFTANLDVVRDGQAVSARSIMGLMMLGAGIGSTVELRAEGWDAHEALDAIAALIESGFHEQD